MPHSKRGVAVQHSYNNPVDISEGGRLRNLSVAQEELITYATKVSGSCVCGIVLFVCVTISTLMVAVGILYFGECPAQTNIPIYLTVGGTMFLVYVIGRYSTQTSSKGYLTILSVFLMGWLITGSIWIFTLHEPNYQKSAGKKYCHRILYLFSFWITIAEYIMCAILVIYLCILCYLAIPVDVDI